MKYLKAGLTIAALAAIAASTPASASSRPSRAETRGHTARASNPGWIGSVSGSATQNGTVTIAIPASWSAANLIVIFAGLDGPDTTPVTTVSEETTAALAGTSGLSWIRKAHISARQDWIAAHSPLERFGASVAEVWAAYPSGPVSGTITISDSHPATADDGFAVTAVAFSNGAISTVTTLDGLSTRPEVLTLPVPACSVAYAASFAGRVNAAFTPEAGYHLAVQRRAGDDTAGVVGSGSHCLPASTQKIGYLKPNPGDFWEMAVAVIQPAA